MSFSTCVSVSSPAPSLANHLRFSGRGRICSKANVGCGSTGIERLRVLEPQLMPNHVAVIMDGNRRWATERGFAVEAGHEAGRKVLREMSRFFEEKGVKVLSAFAFSTENWRRPKGEIEKLMRLFEEEARESMGTQQWGSTIGDTSKLPMSLRLQLSVIEKITKLTHRGLHRIGALNYGGRQDIVEATKAIAFKVVAGKLLPEEVDESSFTKELQTKCTEYPYPDLLIRTSGEKRLSNFMLWQMAHTELYFVDKCFPDMGEKDFMDALITYQERKKRLHES